MAIAYEYGNHLVSWYILKIPFRVPYNFQPYKKALGQYYGIIMVSHGTLKYTTGNEINVFIW